MAADMNAQVIDLAQIDASMLELLGVKAAGLGGLIKAGFAVPQGFCVTTKAHVIGEIPDDDVLDTYERPGADGSRCVPAPPPRICPTLGSPASRRRPSNSQANRNCSPRSAAVGTRDTATSSTEHAAAGRPSSSSSSPAWPGLAWAPDWRPELARPGTDTNLFTTPDESVVCAGVAHHRAR